MTRARDSGTAATPGTPAAVARSKAKARLGRAAEWSLGLLAVAGIAASGKAILERAARVPDLHVTLPARLEAAQAGAPVLPAELPAGPDRVRHHVSVLVDREPIAARTADLPGDDAFLLRAKFPSKLPPGVHLLEFRPGYGQPEPRSAAVAVVTGPFAEASGWSSRGLRIEVSQDMLDRLGASVGSLLARRVGEKLDVEGHPDRGPVRSDVKLEWTETGLSFRGEVKAQEGTAASFGGALRLEVDGARNLRLLRDGGFESSLEGPIVRKGKLLSGVAAGAGIGLVGGPIGAVGGAIAGFFTGGKVVRLLARKDIESFLDASLDDLNRSIAGFDGIPLGDDGEAGTLELRVSGPCALVAKKSMRVDLDVRLRGGKNAVKYVGEYPGPVASGLVVPTERGRRSPVTVTMTVDAVNRVLFGLWSNGVFQRAADDPEFLETARKNLEQTNYAIEGFRVSGPPTIGRLGDQPLKVFFPRVELLLEDRVHGGHKVALLGANAGVEAWVSPAERLTVKVGEPQVWSTCEAPAPGGGVTLTPCLSELIDLTRRRVEKATDRPRELFDLSAASLLPAVDDGPEAAGRGVAGSPRSARHAAGPGSAPASGAAPRSSVAAKPASTVLTEHATGPDGDALPRAAAMKPADQGDAGGKGGRATAAADAPPAAAAGTKPAFRARLRHAEAAFLSTGPRDGALVVRLDPVLR